MNKFNAKYCIFLSLFLAPFLASISVNAQMHQSTDDIKLRDATRQPTLPDPGDNMLMDQEMLIVLDDGEIEADKRGYLGAHVKNAATGGVVIESFTEGSPAEAAGLKAGDMILSLNAEKVIDMEGLIQSLGGFAPNEKVQVTYQRDDVESTVDITLAKQAKVIRYTITGDEPFLSNADKPAITADPFAIITKSTKKEIGVLIQYVKKGGQGDSMGLKNGDILLEVNQEKIHTNDDYQRVVSQLPKGKPVEIKIQRGDQTIQLNKEGKK